MSRPTEPRPVAGAPSTVDALVWARQEAARRAAGADAVWMDPAREVPDGVGGAGSAPVDRFDLTVARALRTPPPMALPPDFAARLARDAMPPPRAVRRDPDARPVVLGLLGLIALVCVSAVAWVPAGALGEAARAWQGPMEWVAAIAACLLLSTGCERLLRGRPEPRPA